MAEDLPETVSVRIPPDLGKRLNKATAGALAPSKSQILLQGLRLALTEIEKKDRS